MSYSQNGSGSLHGDEDVALNNTADGQALVYNGSLAKWENSTLTEASIQNLSTDLSAKAPLASPTFTGTVTVPTPVNTTDASTKNYVDSSISALGYGSFTTPESYGAYGDGSHDDTTAIQNALNYIVANYGTLWFSPGKTYKISSALQVGTSTYQGNYHIVINDAMLLQTANNTPILHFTKQDHRRFSVTGGHFKWSTAQTTADPSSIAIFFDADTSSTDGIYNFRIDECYFENGFRGISNTNDTGPVPGGALNLCPVWGGRITNLRSGSTMVGAQVCIVQGGTRIDSSSIPANRVTSPSAGSPNNYVGNCHQYGQSLTEPGWIFREADGLVLENFEIDEFNANATGSTTPITTMLAITSVTNAHVIGIRTEAGIHTSPGDALWSFQDARVEVRGASVTNTTFQFASSGIGYIFNNTGGNYSKINICDVTFSNDLTLTNATCTGIKGTGTNMEWRFFGYWYIQPPSGQNPPVVITKVDSNTSQYVVGTY